METPNSYRTNPCEAKKHLADILKKAVTIKQHATLVARATVAQLALSRTLECAKNLEKALRSSEGEFESANWVKAVLPVICFSSSHIPDSLRYNRELVEELTSKLSCADGDARQLLANLLRKVERATEQHHRLYVLLVRVNDRFLAGLANYKD